MTIEQAIKKAVKEGYNHFLHDDKTPIGQCISDILLDPQFWQALGKTMKWGEKDDIAPNRFSNWGKKGRKNELEIGEWVLLGPTIEGKIMSIEKGIANIRTEGLGKQYIPIEVLKRLNPIQEWLYYWHQFIDHLAEGKTIEQFFGQLKE